ncbi:MAG TPA: T9SS type A sorting domain-containing protein [Ignavibacteria bacterium]
MLYKNLLILLSVLAPLCFAQPLAFPGAEGAGKYTVGGRGGKVIEVTTLEDSGPGSLRAAIETRGARTVVFRVSGTIKLKSDLKIKYDSITIAGQTAPGDGICLRDYQVVVDANQVIIRYLRFRLGDETMRDTDCFWGRDRKNIIIDHCSMSWSVDETGSFYGNENFTMQWCILSESLYMSVHPKGAHGYGGIWGGTNASFHHNLFAHHSSRTPRFAGGETNTCVNVDFRNNVIYNWGFNSAYGGEGGTINIVANYYKSGPATKSTVKNRIVEITEGTGKWYIADNYVDGYPDISLDNWAGGVQGAYAKSPSIRLNQPNYFVPIDQDSPIAAYNKVLASAGAVLPKRDLVDKRIIEEVSKGIATYEGKFYEIKQGLTDTSIIRGIIDSQKDVGGWPTLKSEEPPIDSDHDGMPDNWEISHGLNPNDPSDRNLLLSDGTTRLEQYLNNLSNLLDTKKNSELPKEFKLYQNYPNPFNPQTNIEISLPSREFLKMVIYDILGREIIVLADGLYYPGNYSFIWNGKDNSGNILSSGIYFCYVTYGNQKKIIKMNLLK